METFAGGQDIDINDLRFPVKSFCLGQPIIVTSPNGSTTTAEPYQTLITGQPITIPPDQTWSLFYVFDNSDGLVTTCPSGQAYSVSGEECTDISGIVQICSEGVFDPDYGTCVIYPEVKGICDKGRWDEEKQACIWNPPVVELPPNYIPPEPSEPEYVCSDGSVVSSAEECVAEEPQEDKFTIGLLLGMIGVMILIIIFKRRKTK